MSIRRPCPYCGSENLEISKYCDNCNRLLLDEGDVSKIQNWVYEPDRHQSANIPFFTPGQDIKKSRFWHFIKFDPIVKELLKAGTLTFFQHIQIYLILILGYLAIFSTFAGIFVLFGDIKILFPTLSSEPPSIIVGTSINFLIAWLITTTTQHFAYRNTLIKGELGIKFDFPGSPREQFVRFFSFSAFQLCYFILWAAILRAGSILNTSFWTSNRQSPPPIFARIIAFLFTFTIIVFFTAVFFFFTVRFTFATYNLELNKVPMEAVDGVLFILGLTYGLLLLGMSIMPYPFTPPEEIVTLVTFILPGTVIAPIFAYAMAHLKIASSIPPSYLESY
ncbi:MAG: zinc ribbon domain-containing protein [Candidatus Hodarchaeales archaeon]|jgi:hypothetical protein